MYAKSSLGVPLQGGKLQCFCKGCTALIDASLYCGYKESAATYLVWHFSRQSFNTNDSISTVTRWQIANRQLYILAAYAKMQGNRLCLDSSEYDPVDPISFVHNLVADTSNLCTRCRDILAAESSALVLQRVCGARSSVHTVYAHVLDNLSMGESGDGTHVESCKWVDGVEDENGQVGLQLNACLLLQCLAGLLRMELVFRDLLLLCKRDVTPLEQRIGALAQAALSFAELSHSLESPPYCSEVTWKIIESGLAYYTPVPEEADIPVHVMNVYKMLSIIPSVRATPSLKCDMVAGNMYFSLFDKNEYTGLQIPLPTSSSKSPADSAPLSGFKRKAPTPSTDPHDTAAAATSAIRRVIEPAFVASQSEVRDVGPSNKCVAPFEEPGLFASARRELVSRSTAELAALLALNGMKRTGTKTEMLERCVEAVVNGAVPRCPRCLQGFLRVHWDRKGSDWIVSYACPGGFDEITMQRTDCSFRTHALRRDPWRWR